MPPWLTFRLVMWLLALGGLLFGVWKYGHSRYEAGEREVKAEWNASIERGRKEVERLKTEAGKVTVKVETKYVDRVKTIREKGETIVQVREVFVPVDSGYLSGGFRLFYDAAIQGAVPDSAGIANAAPVPIAAVADTHARNTEKCHIAYATVNGLREWITEQQRINP